MLADEDFTLLDTVDNEGRMHAGAETGIDVLQVKFRDHIHVARMTRRRVEHGYKATRGSLNRGAQIVFDENSSHGACSPWLVCWPQHDGDTVGVKGHRRDDGGRFAIGIERAYLLDVAARGNRETLSMVMLDYDYDTEADVFDLDEVYYAGTIEAVGWEVRFPANRLGAQVMAVFLDIYGNEARVVIPSADFGPTKATRAKTAPKKATTKATAAKPKSKKA